ncbi:sulfite exporter TauE/SafE family protein [Helicobacter mastomyrinus]|uniref:Sulfite exporter TauE/SafE family protein n=1 Tax=Helicobacter mastomyrinus TaxID=287948 RepID=A0ABZ3F3M0_9HELI
MEHIEILTLISIAFFASLGHCVGMCGGIVLAFSALYAPAQNTTKYVFLSQIPLQLLYHSGKITTYCVLGFIAGNLGYLSAPNETIKYAILLVVGILLVLGGLGIAQFIPIKHYSFKIPFSRKVLHFMQNLLTQGSKWRLYMLGLCNGLLPCGIVYYFLLTAAVAGNGINGAIVMGIFGVCAMPSLFILGLVSASVQRKRTLFLRLSGIGMVILGFYEIYKALKVFYTL